MVEYSPEVKTSSLAVKDKIALNEVTGFFVCPKTGTADFHPTRQNPEVENFQKRSGLKPKGVVFGC